MKIHKTVATELFLLAQICTKSFVGWGFAPDPTGGAYSATPDPLAGLRGPTSKGGEERGVEGREGKESAPLDLNPGDATDCISTVGGDSVRLVWSSFVVDVEI